MDDSSSPSPASPPLLEPKRRPQLGVASFILALISVILACLFFIFAYWDPNPNYGWSIYTVLGRGISAVGWIFICGLGISTLTGIGLGIAAVVQKTRSKRFGILGIVFNTLILLGFCVLNSLLFFLALASWQ
jgi:hypothetical protein